MENLIEASHFSLEFPEAHEIIYLTDGLVAILQDDEMVRLFPVWRKSGAGWSDAFPAQDFRKFLQNRNIEMIGIKEVTKMTGGNHWSWAPETGYGKAPDNNPSYRWTQLSSSILRALKNDETYPSLGHKAPQEFDSREMENLATSAKHIAISLHQMNLAIVLMAEYFQGELPPLLDKAPPTEGPRYKRLRHLDLTSHVHSFFQAYSAARDHYARFVAIQISRPKVNGHRIDSMASLLNSIDPDELRVLPVIRQLEKENFLHVGKGGKAFSGEDRLVFSKSTWLHNVNTLRNRFTHRAPYGTSDGEDVVEVW
jgi:hypothetical protein